ncbi:type II secretion system protein GspD [Bacteroidota bacterium]
MRLIITSIMTLLIALPIFAQTDLQKQLSGYVNPDELITLSATIPFDQAIGMLNSISENMTGKRIVSTAGYTDPIGIEIDKMPYKKALTIIVQFNQLIYEEKEDVIIVKKLSDAASTLSADIYAPISEREVKITALFFEANITEMKERGINWQFILSQSGLDIGGQFISFTPQEAGGQEGEDEADAQLSPDFALNTATDFTLGNFEGNATAMFRFFENENIGEIIARPTVTVRNKNEGRIQIGSDISIKERDFSGNLIDRFYATGTIIQVTPYIYSEEGMDYVLLKLSAQRSSAEPGTITTTIRKTEAQTEVLMLDGEEKAISGLFVNEETSVRVGIPILKDLPWWFFGLRYIFGYDRKVVTKKEIVILVKAEIVPALKDRTANKSMEMILKEKMENDAEFLEKYKSATRKTRED